MKIYALTELGKKVAKTKDGSDEEMRVIHFIRDHKSATDSELEVVADSYVVKHLIRDHIVKELTS